VFLVLKVLRTPREPLSGLSMASLDRDFKTNHQPSRRSDLWSGRLICPHDRPLNPALHACFAQTATEA
jgi:hypothetical protein